jgi:hypothetical protein
MGLVQGPKELQSLWEEGLLERLLAKELASCPPLVLGTKSRTLCKLGKCPITDL